MKTILFIRHGKSSWDIENLEDFYRPLSERGIKDAIKMGRYLKNIQLVPELCLCSPSHRTIATYSIIHHTANWKNVKLKTTKKIYESSGEKIKSVLKHIDDKFNLIALVGHEPSLSEFITENCNYRISKFPTASIALVVFKDLKKWKKIDKKKGDLEFVISPKQLTEADVK
ncbi:MAG: SixA phosphatase family protein [Bacteroidia bacterium]